MQTCIECGKQVKDANICRECLEEIFIDTQITEEIDNAKDTRTSETSIARPVQ